MKRKLAISLLMFFTGAGVGYAQAQHDLLGVCTRDSLMKAPFVTWYQQNYNDYQPEETTLAKLKQLTLKDVSIEIFFGTWCGDSKREVPRFLKLVDRVGIPNEKIKLIAVATGEQYKQSPGGETNGRSIYRVATFIISRNGKEINRITEHPVRSLELDLYDILSGSSYQSNYRTYPLIDTWMREGLLTSANVSIRGLAKQLKPVLISQSELNACGHVLLTQGKVSESISVFRINSYVFPDLVDPLISLAESLTKTKKDTDKEEAIQIMKRAFQLNENDERWEELLEAYWTIRSGS